MRPFAAKLRDGSSFLGIGLSDQDILRLKTGGQVLLDLRSVGVGLWIKEADGERTFAQPRDSKIVIIPGDTTDEISEFLQVELP